MAGGSESRRSMASASVAAHRAEANVADARLARYNDRIGRVRKERAVWPGAAFIVEALLLLVFLTGSLAVLMNLNAEADRIGRESADLMDGLVLASNVAEEFAADPIAFKEAYEADPMADRWLSQPAHEVENGSDLLSAECTFRTEDTEAGTMHYLTLEVWKVRVLNDSAKAAEEGIGFAPGGLCFEKWEESPVYALETSRYVPADGARTARSATGAADDATRSVVLDDPAAPPWWARPAVRPPMARTRLQPKGRCPMAKPHGSVRIGPISLFTLIIVLCLAVLTVLSVTTSLAELSTTERQAATTTETYQLESVGQQFVADVDAALAEGTLEDVLQRYSDSTVRDGELISATFSMESGRTLAIVLRIQNNTYTIEQWKVTAEWIDDGTGENLWLG